MTAEYFETSSGKELRMYPHLINGEGELLRIAACLILLWSIVLSWGCRANPMNVNLPGTITASTTAESFLTPAIATGEIPMTPSTPVNPAMQNVIEKAKTDLAQRLSVSIPDINLVEITEVEWSDSSMDCPQPGMDYLQVITPGFRILLEGNGNVYEYHSNRDTYVILCENPNSPGYLKP